MKLIRDEIAKIIINNNQDKWKVEKCRSQTEKFKFLLEKLNEETTELLQNPCVEEIVDVLEVAYSIANVLGISDSDVDLHRKSKKEECGGFADGFILKKIDLINDD